MILHQITIIYSQISINLRDFESVYHGLERMEALPRGTSHLHMSEEHQPIDVSSICLVLYVYLRMCI